MTTSLGQTVLYSLISPVRVVAVANVAGTYYNGPSNNGVGATLTIAASSLTIDSVVLEVGDRVLLTTQTSTYQNGIYIVKEIGTTVILQRSDDQQNIEQLKIGQLVTVGAGTVNAGSAFVLVAPLPQFIGVDGFFWASSPISAALGTAGAKAASNNALSTLASTAGGGFVAGNFTIASDTLGTIEDSGVAPGDLFLNNLTDGHIFVGDATNNAADVAVTGDITITNTGVVAIATGVIVNADINAAAAIAFSKLATLASGNLLVGSAGGVATSVAMSGDATIVASGALTIANNAITTAKILNANVTLAKLAAGITPSHVIKFANQVTTVGGAAAEAITVTGAVGATDRAFVQVVNDGTSNVTVLEAVVTDNTLTVTFSANPGNDTVINYQIIRAAA